MSSNKQQSLSKREQSLLQAAKASKTGTIERRQKTKVSFDNLTKWGMLDAQGRITEKGEKAIGLSNE